MSQERRILSRSARPNIDPELAAEMAEDKATYGDSDGTPIYKVPEDGRPHLIRVLPGNFGKSGKKWYVAQAQHWAQTGGRRTPYDCPFKGLGLPCPFCDSVKEYRDIEAQLKDEMKRQPSKECRAELDIVDKIIKGCMYRVGYALNVINRDDADLLVRKFNAPKTVFAVFESYYANHGDVVLDGYEGYDFSITRKKVRGFTNYDVRLDLQPTSIGETDAQIQDALNAIHDLEASITFEDYDKLKIAFDAMVHTAKTGDDGDGSDRDLGDGDDFDQSHRRGGGVPPQRQAGPPAQRQIRPPARRPTQPSAEEEVAQPARRSALRVESAARPPAGSNHPDDQIEGVKPEPAQAQVTQPVKRVSALGRTAQAEQMPPAARPRRVETKPEPTDVVVDAGDSAEDVALGDDAPTEPQAVPDANLMDRLRKLNSEEDEGAL